MQKKTNKKIKKKTYILWVAILLELIAGGVYIYHYNPKVCAYRYIFAYNKKDFEKVYSFYNQEAIGNKFAKEEIIAVLKDQSKKNHTIKAEKLTVVEDEKTKRWFVEFPYRLQNIDVFTPAGASVYVDHKKIIQGVKGKGIQVKDLLPGKHQVTIEYHNNMCPNFTTEIDVPDEVKVRSPYDTLDILVVAPVGTWVKVGNIIKYNPGEKVLFDNMLPGQYDVSILMGDKGLEVFAKKIQIDKQSPVVHVENIMGNQQVKQDLQGFFQRFNREYKAGIMKKDTTFFHKFLTDPINEDVISDFKMWYIDHKDIKDAKSLMEVRESYLLSGNELKASVLETVYLINIEKNGDGQAIERQYRVVIEWNYKLVRNNATWQIASREILQSMVAYKNEGEKWLKY